MNILSQKKKMIQDKQYHFHLFNLYHLIFNLLHPHFVFSDYFLDFLFLSQVTFHRFIRYIYFIFIRYLSLSLSPFLFFKN